MRSRKDGRVKANGNTPDDLEEVVDFSINGRRGLTRQTEAWEAGGETKTLSRASSVTDMVSIEGSNKPARKRKSTGDNRIKDDSKSMLESDEMFSRASNNYTFVSIKFAQTILVISYKVSHTLFANDHGVILGCSFMFCLTG